MLALRLTVALLTCFGPADGRVVRLGRPVLRSWQVTFWSAEIASSFIGQMASFPDEPRVGIPAHPRACLHHTSATAQALASLTGSSGAVAPKEAPMRSSPLKPHLR
jgi:hypothetical protein